MSKGRHYVFPDERGGTALDPRLLLVEFNSSILLHQSQVSCNGCMSYPKVAVVERQLERIGSSECIPAFWLFVWSFCEYAKLLLFRAGESFLLDKNFDINHITIALPVGN